MEENGKIRDQPQESVVGDNVAEKNETVSLSDPLLEESQTQPETATITEEENQTTQVQGDNEFVKIGEVQDALDVLTTVLKNYYRQIVNPSFGVWPTIQGTVMFPFKLLDGLVKVRKERAAMAKEANSNQEEPITATNDEGKKDKKQSSEQGQEHTTTRKSLWERLTDTLKSLFGFLGKTPNQPLNPSSPFPQEPITVINDRGEQEGKDQLSIDVTQKESSGQSQEDKVVRKSIWERLTDTLKGFFSFPVGTSDKPLSKSPSLSPDTQGNVSNNFPPIDPFLWDSLGESSTKENLSKQPTKGLLARVVDFFKGLVNLPSDLINIINQKKIQKWHSSKNL